MEKRRGERGKERNLEESKGKTEWKERKREYDSTQERRKRDEKELK